MPETNTNLSNVHAKSLLKRDYRRFMQSNQAFWADYREKQKDENIFQSLLSFGVGIIGGVIGFATGGLPGAKAGFSWGSSLAKIGYLADNREFDAEEHLYKNKQSAIGKFNTLENTKLFNEAVNNAKDDKLADQLDAGFSLLQSGWNAGQAGGDTVHGVSKSDWDNMNWFGEGGRVRTMFQDIRTSNLEKLAAFYNNGNVSPNNLSNTIGINAPDFLNPSSGGGIGIASPNFITFNPLQNENAIRGAFGDILSDTAIKTIASKTPNELIDILEEATESNNTENLLKQKLNLDLKDIERLSLSDAPFRDEMGLGYMVQYGKTYGIVDDSLMSHDEWNDRMLAYARSFKAPIVRPSVPIESEDEFFDDPLTIKDTELEELAPFITQPSSPAITSDIEDLNNLAMENLTSPALDVLDDFPNLINENRFEGNIEPISAASELSSGSYQYPINDFRVPTISGEEIYGLQEIKEALGISLYNNDIDSWDIQKAIDAYLENPNRNKPDGVNESVWSWLININSGDF